MKTEIRHLIRDRFSDLVSDTGVVDQLNFPIFDSFDAPVYEVWVYAPPHKIHVGHDIIHAHVECEWKKSMERLLDDIRESISHIRVTIRNEPDEEDDDEEICRITLFVTFKRGENENV